MAIEKHLGMEIIGRDDLHFRPEDLVAGRVIAMKMRVVEVEPLLDDRLVVLVKWNA
jgi:hypothetical protein